MILFTVLGWVLVNFATWLSFDYLQELAQSLPEGPEKEEIVKRRAKDGGPLMGALLGGWLLALLYYLIWLSFAWITTKLLSLRA